MVHELTLLIRSAASDVQPETMEATTIMCVRCFDVLVNQFQTPANVEDPEPILPPLKSRHIECPLFVTWEKRNNDRYELRGCIGTLAPRHLVSALGDYASLSAFRDKRFRPIALTEVPQLRVSVSLLVKYEDCHDWKDWVVGTHGIVLKFRAEDREYSATYLPEVAKQQQWDQHQAITSLIRKAGYKGIIDIGLLERLHCTRYQSSKVTMTFDEYAQWREQDGRPLALPTIQTLHGGSSSTSCVMI